MTTAPPEISVEWKTQRAEADRLLEDAGVPLLLKLLERIRQAAAQRRWPLNRIRVEHYQDPEMDWEYLLLVMDFDCPWDEAEAMWEDCLQNVVGSVTGKLTDAQKNLLRQTIHYEFESNP